MGLIIRTLLLLMLLLAGALISNAQTFEVPKIEYASDLCELRNENRVFVHAPLSARQELVKELRKHSDLVIAERPEQADYLLIFAYTPFAVGSTEGSTLNGAVVTARAELTVVKFVNHRVGEARPRILYHWWNQKSFHSLPMPLSSMTTNGFSRPRSGKSVVEELIARLALWAVGKKWPNTFHFDQFTNLLTVKTGGKLERKGAKTFLKALEDARKDSYARRCVAPSKLPLLADAIYAAPLPRGVIPRIATRVPAPSPALPNEGPQLRPHIQSRSQYGLSRRRSFKPTKKGRKGR